MMLRNPYGNVRLGVVFTNKGCKVLTNEAGTYLVPQNVFLAIFRVTICNIFN